MMFDLMSLGWDEGFQASYTRFDRPDQQPARVIRVDRGICSVLGPDGAHRASIGGGLLAVAARDPVRLPCAGDWVVVRAWPDERTTIEAVLPRRTAIVRASAGAEALAQVLAANVDAAGVVASVDPDLDLGRIERLLALAWESGAQPLVILTKMDLATGGDPAAIADQVAEATPGVTVYPVSAARGTGLEPLRPFVAPGRTLGLLGPSGAGKSTLVNALAGATVMGTQSIRRADGRGRHTTTYRALIPLPGGGAVLDTPGIRAVGMFDGVGGLERAFSDIDGVAASCQFRDCSHQSEPGCAVLAALESGELAPRRLHSWRKLQREVAYETRRHDVRVAGQERLRHNGLAAGRRRGARP
jgi:ribosome biogenesis GTPase / thiamine phosphate phosphatase